MTKRRLPLIFACAAVFCGLLILFIPEARNGAGALCNRLFEASEAVNAYAYARFPVAADQDTTLAVALLSLGGCALAAWLAAARGSGPALCAGAALAVGQAYFGLSLPAWANAGLYAALAFLTLRRPAGRKEALLLGAAALAVFIAVALLKPGVDAGLEAASERARDQLSRLTQQLAGFPEEEPEQPPETRHANIRALSEGERAAREGQAYRLVTLEEQQISMPRWIDYLKIVLMLLLAAAVVAAPFLPFALLNARRGKAREKRAAFDSEDAGEAIRAMFRHAAAWLEASGCGGGNRPYGAWVFAMNAKMPQSYIQRYAECVTLFEEAAYSDHAMDEDQLSQVRALLEETERLLLERADWKRRFRLKYVECLCE